MRLSLRRARKGKLADQVDGHKDTKKPLHPCRGLALKIDTNWYSVQKRHMLKLNSTHRRDMRWASETLRISPLGDIAICYAHFYSSTKAEVTHTGNGHPYKICCKRCT